MFIESVSCSVDQLKTDSSETEDPASCHTRAQNPDDSLKNSDEDQNANCSALKPQTCSSPNTNPLFVNESVVHTGEDSKGHTSCDMDFESKSIKQEEINEGSCKLFEENRSRMETKLQDEENNCEEFSLDDVAVFMQKENSPANCKTYE